MLKAVHLKVLGFPEGRVSLWARKAGQGGQSRFPKVVDTGTALMNE